MSPARCPWPRLRPSSWRAPAGRPGADTAPPAHERLARRKPATRKPFPALIPLHQRTKGLRVAGLRRFDQRPIVARPFRTLTHTDALDWGKFTRVPDLVATYQSVPSGRRGLGGNPRTGILV